MYTCTLCTVYCTQCAAGNVSILHCFFNRNESKTLPVFILFLAVGDYDTHFLFSAFLRVMFSDFFNCRLR